MSNVRFGFDGKLAVVTGGAQGIGFEITKQFLVAGSKVAVWDYSTAALDSAKAELAQFADRVQFQQVNVTDRANCAAAAAAIAAPVDILVNNAGITRDKSFAKMTGDDFDSVIQTNLTGLFNVTQALLGKFNSTAKANRIINMASVVALYGNFGQTNYAAAKAGVVGMTKTWARELGRKGFTVNAVAPGFVVTKMTEAMPKEVLESIVAKVPVGRMASTEDIANACLFLASDAASYVNGTVISVDGGLVLG
jgi:3-oxoacyl-[acyl-carrier protein] reductase